MTQFCKYTFNKVKKKIRNFSKYLQPIIFSSYSYFFPPLISPFSLPVPDRPRATSFQAASSPGPQPYCQPPADRLSPSHPSGVRETQ